MRGAVELTATLGGRAPPQHGRGRHCSSVVLRRARLPATERVGGLYASVPADQQPQHDAAPLRGLRPLRPGKDHALEAAGDIDKGCGNIATMTSTRWCDIDDTGLRRRRGWHQHGAEATTTTSTRAVATTTSTQRHRHEATVTETTTLTRVCSNDDIDTGLRRQR